MTALSVVLATRDRPELLRGAIDALLPALRDGDEVIVVDSASTDPRVREIVDAAGVGYLRCDRPGAALARNAGWRAATNPIVAFTDDDVRVEVDWAKRIDDAMAAHPDVAFLTGRVLEPPDDAPSERAVAIQADPLPFPIERTTTGPLGQTANTAIRRAALAAIGGFDEQLGPGGPLGAIAEDVDLYDRLLGAGFRGRYDPDIGVFHVQWRRRPQLVKLDWHYGLGSGYRVAKVLRLDRPRARLVARAAFWDWGVAMVLDAMRHRAKALTLFSTVRTLGMCVGLARGLVTPLDGGHLAPRRARRRA